MSLAFNTVARMTNSMKTSVLKYFQSIPLPLPFTSIFSETWLYVEIAGIFLFGLDSTLSEDL